MQLSKRKSRMESDFRKRFGVVLEAGFVFDEGFRVEAPATVLDGDRVNLVEHFVEHDPLDEEARDEGAVE